MMCPIHLSSSFFNSNENDDTRNAEAAWLVYGVQKLRAKSCYGNFVILHVKL